jgi:glycosyltransferase involved in cell wall biosynthesis
MRVTRVSIVVPNYNHAAYLDARLDSVLGQTYPDFEVLLLDDVSSDDSRALLERRAAHPKVAQLILNRERAGTFAQWQRALELARGEYVWIAESDDVAELSFLERLVPILDAHPRVGLAYAQSWVIDARGELLFDNRRWTDDLDPELFRGSFQMAGKHALRTFMAFKNVIPNTSAVLFRKALFQHVPAEVARFRYAGDWLAWSALLAHSDLYYTPELLNRFRRHAATTRVKRTFRETARYLNENYRILEFIARAAEPDRETLEKARTFIAKKFHREIGPRWLLDGESRALAAELSAFDPWLRARLLRMAAGRAKRKLLGALPSLRGR